MNLTILMTSYHRPRDFRRSAHSLLQHTPELGRLIIMDNSTGALDKQLDDLCGDRRVSVIRNPTNLGKGRSFRLHSAAALAPDQLDHFVGADADVVVAPDWYRQLLLAARLMAPWAAIAPQLVNRRGEPVLHVPDNRTVQLSPGIWYNVGTAGPLLLIRKRFWYNWGGYPGDQLYGNDDGALCRAAARRGLFIGYTDKVVVEHSDADGCAGYREWKHRNIRGDVDGCGYWDIGPRISHPG